MTMTVLEGFHHSFARRICGYDVMEGKHQGMGVGLSGYRVGSDRDFSDTGVHAEAAGKNCGVRRREANLLAVCSSIEYVGIQKVTQEVGPNTRPHTRGEEGRLKDKYDLV